MAFVRTVLSTGSGVLVWAAHFMLVYGWAALACARGYAALPPWVVGVLSLAAAALCGALALHFWRTRARFERALGGGLAALALVAILWESLPLAMVPPCR